MNVSLTPRQIKLIREGIHAGQFGSPNEVVQAGLRALIQPKRAKHSLFSREFERLLASGYKAAAKQDREIAQQWAQLPEAWPAK